MGILVVPEEKKLGMLGVSYFAGVGYNLKTKAKIYGDMNSASRGRQLGNPGYDKTQSSVVNYTKEQINSLKILLANIVKIYNISPKVVLANSDVAPGRKFAPGFYFLIR